jgi:hypothetical protein
MVKGHGNVNSTIYLYILLLFNVWTVLNLQSHATADFVVNRTYGPQMQL